MKVEIKMGCDMNFDLAHLQPCSLRKKSGPVNVSLCLQILPNIATVTIYNMNNFKPLVILFIVKKKPRVIDCQGFNLWWKRFCFIVYYTCADLGGGGLWGDLIPPSLQNSNSLNMPQTPTSLPPLPWQTQKNCWSPYPGKLFWMWACYITITEDNHDNCTCYWSSS